VFANAVRVAVAANAATTATVFDLTGAGANVAKKTLKSSPRSNS